MSPSGSHQLTQLLRQWKNGDKNALDSLMPVVYSELRRLAHQHLQAEPSGHTWQSTALVHEAYLRLLEHPVRSHDGKHFFALAAGVMRQILVDFARARNTAGSEPRCTVAVEQDANSRFARDLDLLALDQALNELSRLCPRQSRIVELRFFAGLSIAEISEILGVSPACIERDWMNARAWLYREMSRSAHP